MKPANNAPIYIGAYKELTELAREHGYAMAVHGSVARDLDLICIPWIEDASDPQAVVDEITSKFAFKEIDKPARISEHGRIVFTLAVSFGDCFIDLSFTPKVAALSHPADGWRLVPVEPTTGMLRAAGECASRMREVNGGPCGADYYRAMIDASPLAVPATQEAGE